MIWSPISTLSLFGQTTYIHSNQPVDNTKNEHEEETMLRPNCHDCSPACKQSQIQLHWLMSAVKIIEGVGKEREKSDLTHPWS